MNRRKMAFLPAKIVGSLLLTTIMGAGCSNQESTITDSQFISPPSVSITANSAAASEPTLEPENVEVYAVSQAGTPTQPCQNIIGGVTFWGRTSTATGHHPIYHLESDFLRVTACISDNNSLTGDAGTFQIVLSDTNGAWNTTVVHEDTIANGQWFLSVDISKFSSALDDANIEVTATGGGTWMVTVSVQQN